LKAGDGLFLEIQAPSTVAIASYGFCCSYCSYNIRVEKEEEVVAIQEHKKPTRKRNPINSKLRKICRFQHLATKKKISRIKLNRNEGKKM
jgi:hypothetical protein